MIATSKITRKNQTTVPQAVLKALGAKPSDDLVYEIEASGQVMLRARTGRLVDLAKIPPAGPKPKRPLSVEAMSKAAQEAAAESALRPLRRPKTR